MTPAGREQCPQSATTDGDGLVVPPSSSQSQAHRRPTGRASSRRAARRVGAVAGIALLVAAAVAVAVPVHLPRPDADDASRAVQGRIAVPAPATPQRVDPPVAPVSPRLLGALRGGTLIPRARSVASDVIDAAIRHQVDPLLLHAIILVESGYRNDAVSPAGARGLMQIMPGTGAQFGVRNESGLHEPSRNVDAGARYLSWLHERFAGHLPLVVAAYNAGPGAVQKAGGRVPPYPETRAYVDDVMWLYGELTLARDRRASN